MQNPDDKEILDLFNSDKEKAFRIIVQKYSKPLYSQIRKILISHEDSNDALQETFINIYLNLETFRSESGLFSWLYRIAVNQALNFYKKQKRSFAFSAISYEDSLASKLQSDPYFDGDELQLKLQKAVLKLPVKQRLVFNMKYYDDMKYEEISRILTTSVGALKASYHHAIKKIEKEINSD